MGDWKLVVGGNRADSDEAPAAVDASKKVKQGKATAAAGAHIELFNLTEDISEKTNLADQHPDKVKELRARLDAFAQQAVPPKSSPKAADFQTPKVWGERP